MLVKESNGIKTFYVYGLGLIGEETNGQYRTYHFDYRGSTVALTNLTGQVTQRFQYAPYGKLVSGDVSQTPFLFNGMYGVMTDDNGLYYMRARFYSPEIKRFINQDILFGSIADGQTLNRFAFVTGNPVSFVDPFGLSEEEVGFWESVIPLWGSGKTAYYNFENGQWAWGTFNSLITISDIFLVKSLVIGTGKLACMGIVAKGGGKEGSEKLILNIGSGNNPINGAINLDIFSGKGVNVIGDARSLPFQSDSFDRLIGQALPSLLLGTYGKEVAGEAYRVLKSGGTLEFTSRTALNIEAVENIFLEPGFSKISVNINSGITVLKASK